MIIKSYEINKIDYSTNNLILLHGKNEGLKNEIEFEFISKNKDNKIFKYDEKEILENNINFYNIVSNESLFDISKKTKNKYLSYLDLDDHGHDFLQGC